MTALRKIDPHKLQQRMQADEVVLIDIRSPREFAHEHIEGAQLVPLGSFDRHDFPDSRRQTAVFTCRSGARTTMAANRLLAKGFRSTYVLEGGLDAWKRAGLPVQTAPAKPLSLQRQVHLIAGSLALAGAILAWRVAPEFILLSGFVGAGLLLNGLTGFCGMARLLTLMPWNRQSASA
ncbi:rhodanese family protein [Ferrovibrio sp.]|uniref:rhodanese-like domain-containing protein n=1 Tax=Ferrovibrio sp. TaxID=1917215 RepID=UPI002636B524|nr:rhodanese family protein [Ferrovibrio sp.]